MNGAGRERECTKRSSLILNSKTVYVLSWQLLGHCGCSLSIVQWLWFFSELTWHVVTHLSLESAFRWTALPASGWWKEDSGWRSGWGALLQSLPGHTALHPTYIPLPRHPSLQHHLLSLHLGFLIFRMGPIIFVPIEWVTGSLGSRVWLEDDLDFWSLASWVPSRICLHSWFIRCWGGARVCWLQLNSR